MTSTVRRAGAFAAVGTLAFVVPLATRLPDRTLAAVAAAVPFAAVAAFALYVVDEDGLLFELFARPGDRRDGRLYGLASFALAAAGLALLAVRFGLPTSVYVAAVLLLAYGNLAGHVVRAVSGEPVVATAGFVVGGTAAAVAGQYVVGVVVGPTPTWPLVVFFAASGALLGALLRSVLFERDDPLVVVSVALLLWLFSDLPLTVSPTRVAVALAVTAVLGYIAYALETASLPGMLTGVFLGLLTIVLGDYGWFLMLITFFGVGGLSTKFRYERKQELGLAEDNDGARGSGNVLANSLVALFALLGAAASPSHTTLPASLFLFSFAGAVAAAMSDTLSSEFGGLYENPRLITTFERVDPGTDGGVTWQGELAGLVGAGLIAAIAAGMFGRITLLGAGVVAVAGFTGMTVDSLLGATIEGPYVGNQGVNLLATFAAAIVSAALAVATGFVPL
ncbi:MAG: TIGR00297 family protein [Haloarculaceae archaeon]